MINPLQQKNYFYHPRLRIYHTLKTALEKAIEAIGAPPGKPIPILTRLN